MKRALMGYLLASIFCYTPAGFIRPDLLGILYTSQPDSLAQVLPAVNGAPFTAQQVRENVGTLRDGTRIDRKAVYAVWRDVAGRTRRENEASIWIVDPVARVSYYLDKKSHTATRIPIAIDGREQLQAQAQSRLEGEQSQQTDLENRPQIKHEPLGTRSIEGLQTQGTRTTTIYPIGPSGGSDRPIRVVEEHWYSPELKMDIIHVVDDPRQITQNKTQLTGIRLGEPDASLFQVPGEYALKPTKQE